MPSAASKARLRAVPVSVGLPRRRHHPSAAAEAAPAFAVAAAALVAPAVRRLAEADEAVVVVAVAVVAHVAAEQPWVESSAYGFSLHFPITRFAASKICGAQPLRVGW